MPGKPETHVDILPAGSAIANAEEVLDRYLSRRHLKRSLQRNAVLRIFLGTRESLTMQQLYDRVRQAAPAISYTTVYRSLALFTRCGLAAKIECINGTARFGHAFQRSSRHQVICTICGSSMEFHAPETEKIEQRIEEQLRFTTIRYVFQVYGICENCQRENRRSQLLT